MFNLTAGDFKIVGYLPQYRMDTIDLSIGEYLDDLIYFNLQLAPDASLDWSVISESGIAKVQETKRLNGVRTQICIAGWSGAEGRISQFYNLIPENRVPDKQLPYPWKSCIIMGGGRSYVKDAKFKSGIELVRILVDIVAKGGSLLLNIGPGPDGTWHPDAYDRMEKIGAWMKVDGNAIYATKAIAPYKERKVCLTQNKDGSVNAIYLGDEGEKMPSKIWLSSILPAKNAKLTLLGSNAKLEKERVGSSFVANIPESVQKNPPCNYAWTVNISAIE